MRRARGERLAPYFALQLRLAEAVAARTREPLGAAVSRLTNLQRRFGLGLPDDGEAPPPWRDYLARLSALPTPQDRIAWTVECFAKGPPDRPNPAHLRFGCFSCEPPDAAGSVKIHFANEDSADGTGPLSHLKADRRREELRAMFAQVRETWPNAASVRGASWLYNLKAYRRLFPPAFGASRLAPPQLRLNGTSSWGQFLDHTEAVKPDLTAVFLRNLETLDASRPWLAFPLRALMTTAPIERFYDFYGLQPSEQKPI